MTSAYAIGTDFLDEIFGKDFANNKEKANEQSNKQTSSTPEALSLNLNDTIEKEISLNIVDDEPPCKKRKLSRKTSTSTSKPRSKSMINRM